MSDRLTEVGSVRIDGQPYRLARTEEARAWQRTYEDEPPWAGGLPTSLSAPSQTWHAGGFRSRAGVAPVTEYGQNTDNRFPFRILPAPRLNTVTLSGSEGTPVSFFEALDQLFVLTGRRVFRIDDVGNVILSKDFGADVTAIMGLKWEEDFGLVCTDADENSLWKVTELGGTDTWTQTDDVDAYRLAAGVDRLYKVSKTGILKNISTTLDPMVEANYADEIQCGNVDIPPTGLVAYARTVFVGKPEGLYGVDETGRARPLITRLIRDDDNCKGLTVIDPWVFVPHARGLYRTVPGRVSSAGLEREVLNESPVRGRIVALTSDGPWILASLWTGTDTYILVGRDAESQDDSLGPVVWDTWLYFPGVQCRAMYVSALTSPPRLWLGFGNDVTYVELTTGAGAPDPLGAGYQYSKTGTRWMPRYNFGDWGDKAFIKVVAVGRDVDEDKYWDISYSVDGAAFSDLDADGTVMRLNAVGLQTFILPATAVGRELQLKLDYTSDTFDAAAEIIYLEPFAVPQSRKLPVVGIQLYLAEVQHDQSIDRRSGLDQMNDLQALVEQATPIDVQSAPWSPNTDTKVWIRTIRVIEAYQAGEGQPEFLVQLLLQERET